MISLIKNEITKVLKKKSIYIMLIVILAFVILTNVIYKYSYSSTSTGSYYSEGYINMLQDEMKKLNPENPLDVDQYISTKTELEMAKFMGKYDTNSWQYEVATDKVGQLINNINYSTYKEKDDDKAKLATEELEKFKERLDSGNWRFFAEEELKIAETALQESEQQSNLMKLEVEILKMRLEYNIEYGNNFKNSALEKYQRNKTQMYSYEESNYKTYNDEVEYQEAKQNVAKSLYAIENNKDINNKTNARGILLNLFSEYELFIIITVVLIAGVIVSEEFNKGTIKLLLVRPYSRSKILFSKFVVVILTVIVTMILIGIFQTIIGGLFFGFDSLKIPAVEYNYNTNQLMEMGILNSVILQGLGKLPIYILIGTLAFALGTLFTNTAVAITISLVGYMASSVINQFAYYYNIVWLKYFVTPNWDFTQYLHGKLPTLEGLNIPFSIIICLVYFLIMMIPTFIVFKKKNIKNI